MNNIKTEFTIKDLENFSGIKAHTIRIWEKRYGLFEPLRTSSNIRFYTIDSLKKLLNVTLLYNNGLKISKIADLTNKGIEQKVKELVFNDGFENSAINSFKLAMLNYDEALFHKTYNSLIAQSSFKVVFTNVFIPFLKDIGLLWMVNSITPSHEHFITNLIKQKLYFNIEKTQVVDLLEDRKTFVLFLPLNEIHELGLLYVHFELLLHGYHSIYLGQSVPTENLIDLQNIYNDICFVTYLTVEPAVEGVNEYVESIYNQVLKSSPTNELWIAGDRITSTNFNNIYGQQIKPFNSLKEILKNI